ncbi:hypothetical protein GWI33_014020 [Rhynchophorus ferrugineus]|uniref:Uncharacterized protein n=1 Tax=Rhynchophorus ferrugineus TaxID=354439 RepID=A0A834I707_RHYFE|nr:hypothetical protein GWI33_014020 [Rhynchophorus ferrugineus]
MAVVVVVDTALARPEGMTAADRVGISESTAERTTVPCRASRFPRGANVVDVVVVEEENVKARFIFIDLSKRRSAVFSW